MAAEKSDLALDQMVRIKRQPAMRNANQCQGTAAGKQRKRRFDRRHRTGRVQRIAQPAAGRAAATVSAESSIARPAQTSATRAAFSALRSARSSGPSCRRDRSSAQSPPIVPHPRTRPARPGAGAGGARRGAPRQAVRPWRPQQGAGPDHAGAEARPAGSPPRQSRHRRPRRQSRALRRSGRVRCGRPGRRRR